MDSIFSMKGKYVVVTGGSGMLMTPTIAEMLRLGAKVAVADIAQPQYKELPDDLLVIYIISSATHTIPHRLRSF